MRKKIKEILTVTPLKIASFVIFLSLVMFFMDVPFLRFMELKSLDLRMISRGTIAAGGETVIATIDEKSLSEIGRWPWPRTTIARLVDTLKKHGAKAVGFDIVFAEPDENSSLRTVGEIDRELKQLGIQDKRVVRILKEKRDAADTDGALARAVKKARNVTLGYFFHLSKRDAVHMTEKEIQENAARIAPSKYPVIQSTAETNDVMMIEAYAAVPNLAALAKSAVNAGYFNAIPDEDGTIRWAPLVIRFQGNVYPSLPVAVLMQYLDSPLSAVRTAEYGIEGVRIGDIEIPTDEVGRLLINYLGPAKTFPHYSIADILKGRIPPETFKSKIVLVGATATGIYDLRVTPFSTVYPGLEIHATVIDNILHRNFLTYSGWIRFLDMCVIIVLGLLAGVALPRFGAIGGIGVILALVVSFFLVNTFIFSYFNVWMNLIYPLLTLVVIYLGISIYRYVTEEREKKKIRGAFQYYLTASVINEMLKDPSKLKLGGDKKDLSVLFSDIRGFTTVSEKLSPEELVHLLNEYLTAMTDIVFEYEGLLDKYMGDAIMAVYGAPLDQPDHALRACRTALKMRVVLERLQKKWTEEGRPVLNIGVGINSGDMVVGNMGSEMRFDYTVMGDSVNLGSRLEGINKEYGTGIVISEFTYERVKDTLLCRELDWVRVKGKKLPVKIYELLG